MKSLLANRHPVVEAVGVIVYLLVHVTLREELSVSIIVPKVLDTAGALNC